MHRTSTSKPGVTIVTPAAGRPGTRIPSTGARLARLACAALVAAALLPSGRAGAQSASFGKNKVQYKTFDWHYIQTTHFDIYFDRGTEPLAEFTAAAAESAKTARAARKASLR